MRFFTQWLIFLFLLVLAPVLTKAQIPILEASDGKFANYIRIEWTAIPGATGYRLYRSGQKDRTDELEEVTQGWQTQNWAIDYLAQPGVYYYYRCQVRHGEDSPAEYSDPDRGYRAIRYMALDDRIREREEVLGNPHQPVWVETFYTPDTTTSPGTLIELSYTLRNQSRETVEGLVINIYLSRDVTLSWDDTQVSRFPMGKLEGEVIFENQRMIEIPANQQPGRYYLIMVTAPENKVLKSFITTGQALQIE